MRVGGATHRRRGNRAQPLERFDDVVRLDFVEHRTDGLDRPDDPAWPNHQAAALSHDQRTSQQQSNKKNKNYFT